MKTCEKEQPFHPYNMSLSRVFLDEKRTETSSDSEISLSGEDDWQTSNLKVPTLIRQLTPQERTAAFSTLSMNYVSLEQQMSDLQKFKETLQRLTYKLESILAWEVDEAWSSQTVRNSMVSAWLDGIVDVFGGVTFLFLIGEASGLVHNLTTGALFHISANAYSHMRRMEKHGLTLPRFSEEHTPLFYSVLNTGMSAVYSGQVLEALSVQGRCRIPEGHFPIHSLILLPIGNLKSGVVLGIANSRCTGQFVPELQRLLQRFVDGAVVSYRRTVQKEQQKIEEESTRLVRVITDTLKPALSRAVHGGSDFQSRVVSSLTIMRDFLRSSCAFIGTSSMRKRQHRMKDSNTSKPVLRLVAPPGDEKQQVVVRRADASSATSASRLAIKSVSVKLLAPLIVDFTPNEGETEPHHSLADLLANSPNATNVMKRAMEEQTVIVLHGQDDIGVFQGAIVDQNLAMALIPIWVSGDPIALWILLGPADVLTEPVAQGLMSILREHTKTLVETMSVQQFPLVPTSMAPAVLAEIRRITALRKAGAELRVLDRLPLHRVEASADTPLTLLVFYLSPSPHLWQCVSPDVIAGAVEQATATIRKAAAKHVPNMFPSSACGDTVVLVGGYDGRPTDPVEAAHFALKAQEIVNLTLKDFAWGGDGPPNAEAPVVIRAALSVAGTPEEATAAVVRLESGLISFTVCGSMLEGLNVLLRSVTDEKLLVDAPMARVVLESAGGTTFTGRIVPDSQVPPQVPMETVVALAWAGQVAPVVPGRRDSDAYSATSSN